MLRNIMMWAVKKHWPLLRRYYFYVAIVENNDRNAIVQRDVLVSTFSIFAFHDGFSEKLAKDLFEHRLNGKIVEFLFFQRIGFGEYMRIDHRLKQPPDTLKRFNT